MTEREIFTAALNLADPADRAVYLDQACARDAELRGRVGSLLAEHARLGSFLESSPPEATIDVRLSERPGVQIGPYTLLQQIGEGGFGVVFMAEQTQPVRRKVALKVIKPGMDTRQVIARFEAERQALAVMDHLNIARVLDAGATESGRPYFVMELVRGIPITAYCDDNNLPIRERLALFATVCQAIQHAHTKGIIHRDIKPSNVLVTRQDGQPVVKVIDFGVAKAMGQQLTDKTLFTEFAQMIGTPLYMSPEQAELSSVDIDTRSDIYSLGVLLYEMLTGSTPLSKEQLKQAGFDEIRRIIREDEAPKPSTRISIAEAAPSIAAHRHTDPGKLARVLRGELDWIVMKCLEKERSRRYETASGLVRDVLHYLANEPVSACPPSRWYRFRKLARRNRAIFAGAAASLLLVVLGVAALAASNVLIRQEQARTRAEQKRTDQARKLAEQRAREVRQGLERLKAANALLDRGRWYAFDRQLSDAHAAFTQAVRLHPDHVAVWVERGDLHTRLGLWDLAAADYAREMDLREPYTALRWYQHALLCIALGDVEGYQAICRRMQERFAGTLNVTFAEELARASLLGPVPDADFPWLAAVSQKAVTTRRWTMHYVLGTAHYRAGQSDQAILELNEALAASHVPINRLSYAVLAMAHHRLGRESEARQALDEAARVFDGWTRERYEAQGSVWVTNQGAEAVWPVPWWDYLELQLYYREAKLLIDGSPPPDDPRLHVLRARALAGLRWDEQAIAEYDAALALSPQDPQIRLEAHRIRGSACVHRGQWDQAAAEFAAAAELRPEDAYLWRYRAVAQLAGADIDGYRQTCTEMLERFANTEDGATAGNVLLVCVLRDDALPDMARLLPLTQVAGRVWHWGDWAHGAALYRAHQYEASVQCFETAATVFRPRAWDWCFLAMAHRRLGRGAEAGRCLAEATRWIDEAKRDSSYDPYDRRPAWGNWHETVVYPLLLREAEELLTEESGKERLPEESENRSREPEQTSQVSQLPDSL